MTETWLFIDKDYAALGRDRKQWQRKLTKLLEDRYSPCCSFDSATVGGTVSRVLSCKPKTGIKVEYFQKTPDEMNKDNATSEFLKKLNLVSYEEHTYGTVGMGGYAILVCYKIVDNKCDICEIKDLHKPILPENFDRIEMFTSYNSKMKIYINDSDDNAEYLKNIDLINNHKIDGVLITLNIEK